MLERFFLRQPKQSARIRGAHFLADIDFDTPQAAKLRNLIRDEEFDAVENEIDAAADDNERMYLIEAVGDWKKRLRSMKNWLDETGSEYALAAAGINSVKWAWEARGGARARDTSAEQMVNFTKRLSTIRDLMLSKNALKNVFLAPWLMWYARGISDPELSHRVFRSAVKSAPELRALYSSELITRTGRWYGEDDASLDWAFEVSGRAPGGVGIDTLPVEAHWFVQTAFEDDERPSEYWRQREVKSEVKEIESACRESLASGVTGIHTAQWMLYAMGMCGLWKRGKFWVQHCGLVPMCCPFYEQRPLEAFRTEASSS